MAESIHWRGHDYKLKGDKIMETPPICMYCKQPYDDKHIHDNCKIDKEFPLLNVLEEANDIIHGDRNKKYGHPRDNHGTTAILFSHFLSRKYGKGTTPLLNAEDVCMFNILQKISREANSHSRDNLVDIAGYVGNIEMITEDEKKND